MDWGGTTVSYLGSTSATFGATAAAATIKSNNVDYTRHLYPDTRHGFHNNSTPRYNEAAAKLAWDRTVAFWNQHLT